MRGIKILRFYISFDVLLAVRKVQNKGDAFFLAEPVGDRRAPVSLCPLPHPARPMQTANTNSNSRARDFFLMSFTFSASHKSKNQAKRSENEEDHAHICEDPLLHPGSRYDQCQADKQCQ